MCGASSARPASCAGRCVRAILRDGSHARDGGCGRRRSVVDGPHAVPASVRPLRPRRLRAAPRGRGGERSPPALPLRELGHCAGRGHLRRGRSVHGVGALARLHPRRRPCLPLRAQPALLALLGPALCPRGPPPGPHRPPRRRRTHPRRHRRAPGCPLPLPLRGRGCRRYGLTATAATVRGAVPVPRCCRPGRAHELRTGPTTVARPLFRTRRRPRQAAGCRRCCCCGGGGYDSAAGPWRCVSRVRPCSCRGLRRLLAVPAVRECGGGGAGTRRAALPQRHPGAGAGAGRATVDVGASARPLSLWPRAAARARSGALAPNASPGGGAAGAGRGPCKEAGSAGGGRQPRAGGQPRVAAAQATGGAAGGALVRPPRRLLAGRDGAPLCPLPVPRRCACPPLTPCACPLAHRPRRRPARSRCPPNGAEARAATRCGAPSLRGGGQSRRSGLRGRRLGREDTRSLSSTAAGTAPSSAFASAPAAACLRACAPSPDARRWCAQRKSGRCVGHARAQRARGAKGRNSADAICDAGRAEPQGQAQAGGGAGVSDGRALRPSRPKGMRAAL